MIRRCGELKRLRSRVLRLVTSAILCITVCVLILIDIPPRLDLHIFFLVISFAAMIFSVVLTVREYNRLRSADLIIDNQILHIRPAVVDSKECGSTGAEGIDIYLSCFGILLSSRVICFNRKSNKLSSVEIGKNFISLSYGTAQHTEKTRLLIEPINAEIMKSIAERFRFETGVVAVFTE